MRSIASLLVPAVLPAFLASCAAPAPAPDPVPEPAPSPETAREAAPAPAAANPALLDPALAREKAPESFKVEFTTTKGNFTIGVDRGWAPNGADRFYNLVKIGFFDGVIFFRVIDGFMAQFGIHGDPRVSAAWKDTHIPDDPVVRSNVRGLVSFATAGPDTRTTQLFINFDDNSNLDRMGFSPIGRVVDGMKVVDSLYKGYGEGAPGGAGPHQGRIQREGNAYLRRDFPELDSIKTARIVE